MTTRRASILAAASLAVLLAGCSAHEPPPSYTEDELEQYFEQRLDAAWLNTGLSDEMERPGLDGRIVDRFSRDNFYSLSTCMSDTVFLSSWTMDEVDGGPVFTDEVGEPLDPDDQLAAFLCFDAFPVSNTFRNIMLTDEQRDYLYDYYIQWVVPCLTLNGYELNDDYIPDRARFMGAAGDWSPYYAIVSGPSFSMTSGMAEEDMTGLMEICGGQFADLDVDFTDQYAFGG